MRRLLTVATLALLFGMLPARTEAATISVCASGCTNTNAQLQTAIDNAAFGDTILLQSNFTYVGTFLLRQKTCAANNATCFITIKTGVNSTGTVLSSSLFPAANMRNGPAYTSVLAKLQPGAGSNATALRTVEPAETGSGCASAPCKANWWTVQFVEFFPNAYAGGEMLRLGSNDSAAAVAGGDMQDTRAEIPSHFILDRIYIHGDPVIGSKRAIAVYANDVTIKDSYCADIKNTGGDGQCVYVNNSEGPYVITNNFFEADTENVLFGGDTPKIHQTVTVSASPTPTTTVFTVSGVTDLQVGQGLSCLVSGGTIDNVGTVQSISGNQITLTAALTAAPTVPGACNWGVVPAGLTFTRNYLTKQLAWRNPIMNTPIGVAVACATTGGSLTTGTPYFYRVVARLAVSQGNIARSTASVEQSDTVTSGTTGSCAITWTAVPNATTYYIYGRSAGGENVRFSVTAPTVTFTDTGAAGTTENVPTSTGTKWIVKNLFELKNINGATVQGNLFERAWAAGQSGYCVLFTVANTSDDNASTIVKDVIFRDNIVRSCAGLHQITGHDASTNTQTSQRAVNIQLLNNLGYDIGSFWGSAVPTITVSSPGNSTTAPREGPKDIVIDHYTILTTSADGVLYINLGANSVDYTVQNFTLKNSIFRRGGFGIRYTKSPGGTQIEGTTSWNLGVSGTSVYTKNVNAGGNCTNYPDSANNFCPTDPQLDAEFVDLSAGNYALKTTSAYHNAALDSTDIGAIIPTITAFTAVAVSGDNSGGAPSNPPLISTSVLASIPIGVTYSKTLLGSGGTAPYTWTVLSGALPAGLSLSSGGVISGLPTAAGTATFTVKLTDAAAAIDTRSLDLAVNELILPGPRAQSQGWNEAKLLRRNVCLTDINLVTDQAVVGDVCVDLATGRMGLVTATSPDLVLGTVGQSISNLFFFSPASTGYSTWTLSNASTTELFGATRNRLVFDLTGFTQCRIYMRVATAIAGTTTVTYPQYSIDQGSNWNDLGSAAQTPSIDMSVTTGVATSTWQTLATGAKTDVILRLVSTTAGTVTTQPTVGNVGMNCK